MITNIEKQVLSTVLGEFDPIPLDLNPNHFSTWEGQEIYRAMLDVAHEGMTTNIFSVSERLTAANDSVDWWKSVGEIVADHGGSSTNIESYVKIVKNEYYQRKAESSAKTYLDKVVSKDSSALSGLLGSMDSDVNHHANESESLKSVFDRLDEVANGGLPAVSTGLTELDELLGGWQDSHLIVLAARTGVGKTAAMCNFALSANCSVGIISAEQSHRELMQRMLAIHSGVFGSKFRTGKMTDLDHGKLAQSTADISKRQIRFYDKGMPKIDEVVNAAIQMKHQSDIKILFVDYIQFIKSDAGHSRHENIGDITGTLKSLAKQLDIPVVALAQVGRQAEGRMPNLSDLRESGSIEQDADAVIFLHREAMTNPGSDPNEMDVNVSKNRHGRTDIIKVRWIKDLMRIADL